jgi:glycosyltransferase involved in cell wall biosynthesis
MGTVVSSYSSPPRPRMPDLLVSVVIPTRNRLALLKRAMATASIQTYAPIEIIVVIDGPDPATEAYLRSLNDPLSESLGGADARNAGVSAAHGAWIAFLDDDDEWVKDKIARQMEIVERDGDEWSVIACKVIGRFPDQDYIWPRRMPGVSEPLCEYLFNRSSLFRGEGQLQTSMLLVSRAMMLRLPFSAGLKKHQDTDWYVRAAALPESRIIFVDEPLAIWYLGEDRDSIFRTFDWERSWRWLLGVESLLTRRAFAGFIATQLISEATAQGCIYPAIPFLFWQMFKRGRPRLMDCLLFVGNSLFKPGTRGRLRRLMYRQT